MSKAKLICWAGLYYDNVDLLQKYDYFLNNCTAADICRNLELYQLPFCQAAHNNRADDNVPPPISHSDNAQQNGA